MSEFIYLACDVQLPVPEIEEEKMYSINELVKLGHDEEEFARKLDEENDLVLADFDRDEEVFMFFEEDENGFVVGNDLVLYERELWEEFEVHTKKKMLYEILIQNYSHIPTLIVDYIQNLTIPFGEIEILSVWNDEYEPDILVKAEIPLSQLTEQKVSDFFGKPMDEWKPKLLVISQD